MGRIATGELSAQRNDLDIGEPQVSYCFAQKIGFLVNAFDECDPHCRKCDLEWQAWHTAATANVDESQRFTLTQAIEERYGGRQRVEKVTCLDLAGVGNARQVDAPIALAKRGAELVKFGQHSVIELDAQLRCALNQRAHTKFTKVGTPMFV